MTFDPASSSTPSREEQIKRNVSTDEDVDKEEKILAGLDMTGKKMRLDFSSSSASDNNAIDSGGGRDVSPSKISLQGNQVESFPKEGENAGGLEGGGQGQDDDHLVEQDGRVEGGGYKEVGGSPSAQGSSLENGIAEVQVADKEGGQDDAGGGEAPRGGALEDGDDNSDLDVSKPGQKLE